MKCDVCGEQGTHSMRGAMLCRQCAPIVEERMKITMKAKKRVCVPIICAQLRREAGTDYLLRAVPQELWERVKAYAARRNLSIRDWMLDLMDKNTSA